MIAHLQCWRWFYASIVIGLLAGEAFPFSNWPMYASFGPSSSYVYVTDAAGAPLAHRAVFGESSARLKKRFTREVQSELVEMSARGTPITLDEARQRRGVHLLLRLAARLPADRQRAVGGLRLVYVTIVQADHALAHREATVAAIELPASAQAGPE